MARCTTVPSTHSHWARPRHSWTRRRGCTLSSPALSLKPAAPFLTLLPAPRAISASLLEDGPRRAQAVRLAALAISQRGFCMCSAGVEDDIVGEARNEVAALFTKGAMRPGGFTVAGRDDVVRAKRDDHTLWLHEYLSDVGGPERGGAQTVLALDGVLASFAENVIDALTSLDRPEEPMGRAKDGGKLHYTGRTDLMLACYPGGGAHYGPHVDNADGDGREQLDYGRCFTLVYYLNDHAWDEQRSGGALRMHLAPRRDPHSETGAHQKSGGLQAGSVQAALAAVGAPHEAIDIAPRGDTLIMFRADALLHEVRPALAPRMAATVWLYAGTKEQSARERGRGGGKQRST